MYQLLRPFIFCLDGERAHDLAIASMQRLGRLRGVQTPLAGQSVDLFGLHFANPVGLAAGLDKNAEAVAGLSHLGFGHIEVGTVTPRPQPGNPKPRLFRLTDDQALINRFGFNNDGVDALVARLVAHPYAGVLGVNIGKNKDTPNESAVEDYLCCLRAVACVADYVTINVSSPNTPGLRDLSSADAIMDLLQPLVVARHALANRRGQRLPLLVKLAPDFSDGALVSVLQAIQDCGVDGVILTNTTLSRDGLISQSAREQGGLSGAPLATKARHALAIARDVLGDALPIISVGGIMDGEEARVRLVMGARLVQVYSGLIYRGPRLIKEAVDATRVLR
ncbi:MAG: quinone-dependent dihydroorotate dehydrogenase [Litorivicinaceae bacterium]|jgi:dihydroorotate dehydrogenase|nr:quinone-dependent dihydroorotate dehydrogenase [Litorivicinaceae bacterium]